jgi:hypothetical protein
MAPRAAGGRQMLDSFYQLPIATIGVATFVLLVAAAIAGHVAGHRSAAGESKELNRNVVAGIVGVVALLLAFTLGFALSRFQERRDAIVDEANAVMTAFLHADLLPAAERRELQVLIRDYAATRQFSNVSDMATAITASLAQQDRLWPTAVALSEGRLAGPERTFLLGAINDVLDVHLLRTAARAERVPLPVLGLAVLLTAAAVFLSSYTERSKRFPISSFLIQSLGVATLVTLILDFDDTSTGLIRMDAWIMASTVADMDRLLAVQ